MKLILASSSPRRKQLLETIGIEPVIICPETDETRHAGESVHVFLERVAVSKGMDVYKTSYFADLIISADTIVLVDDRVIGKPGSRADAKEMLQLLSGRRHDVLTGVALLHRGQTSFAIATTSVFFKPLSDRELDYYLDHDEYADKAGAYAIQGRAAVFIDHIEGCFFNVMGFPLNLFYRMCEKIGITLYKENI